MRDIKKRSSLKKVAESIFVLSSCCTILFIMSFWKNKQGGGDQGQHWGQHSALLGSYFRTPKGVKITEHKIVTDCVWPTL